MAECDETIAPGGSWSGIVRRGHILTITDLEGKQGVDFLCYAEENPEERYHAANTLKKAGTFRLTTGHMLYSDIARPMMIIVEDTCGWNDTIAGCCSVPGNRMLYGAESTAGCRENLPEGACPPQRSAGRTLFANLSFVMPTSLAPAALPAGCSRTHRQLLARSRNHRALYGCRRTNLARSRRAS